MAQIAAKQYGYKSVTPAMLFFFFFELFYFGSYFTHFVESIVNQNVGTIRRPLVSKELSEYMVIIQLEEEFKLFPVMLAAHLWLHYT